MLFKHKHKLTFGYLWKNIVTITGIVLVWRGIWHVLDGIDIRFFNGSHFWTGFVGVIIGIIILYIPDKNLKEIEKL